MTDTAQAIEHDPRTSLLADLLAMRVQYDLSIDQITNAMAVWDVCNLNDLENSERIARILPVLATSPNTQRDLRSALEPAAPDPESHPPPPDDEPSLLTRLIKQLTKNKNKFALAVFAFAACVLSFWLFSVEIWLAGAGFTIIGLILVGLWRVMSRAPKVSDLAANVQTQDAKADRALLAMAEALQRHVKVPGRRLDAQATVQASLRRGGLMKPVFRPRRARPETLFLIERQSLNDHLSHLYTQVAQRLRALGVVGEIYHYTDTPKRLIPQRPGKRVVSPAQVDGDPEQQRAVLFGSAFGLLDRFTAELTDWSRDFQKWHHKMVLDPAKPESPNWTPDEMQLAANGWLLGSARLVNLAHLPRQITVAPHDNVLSGQAIASAAHWKVVSEKNKPNVLAEQKTNGAKRIVVFCDGTWNSPRIPDVTNVRKLYGALSKDPNSGQISFYASGIGLANQFHGPVRKLFNKYGGGAFGWGLDLQIKESYKFIAENYQPGTELYIFGASRGAYTARAVVGMIRKCGIVTDTTPHGINKAFDLYLKRGPENLPDSEKIWAARQKLSPEFGTSARDLEMRADSSSLVNIAYLGIWESVGARGLPLAILGPIAMFWNRRFNLHDMRLTSLVRSARHAVAADESRVFFAPALWDNLDGPNGLNRGNDFSPLRPYQQVWFIGDHGIVTGTSENQYLSAIPLLWVLSGAGRLVLDQNVIFPPTQEDPLAEAKSLLPRTSFLKRWRDGPKLSHNVHPSVKMRMQHRQDYRPKSLSDVGTD